jgi:hypothetical protein
MITICVDDSTGRYHDQFGQTWVHVLVDPFAMQPAVQCGECEVEADQGWLCLDGGGELCVSHIEITTPEIVAQLHEEQRESMLHQNRMRRMFSELRRGTTAVIA